MRCATCGKQHYVGFDYDHGLNEADDFISQTIKRVDSVLGSDRDDWEREARREWAEEEQAEYCEIMDAEDDAYWAAHCVKHGDELVGGACVQCEAELAEERIADR